MAEMAGLAISIVSLATTFDSVINCFEYIRLGKTFAGDFQDCLLKLDNARLRLSRWGEAVGLTGIDENTKSLRNTKISEDDIPQAEKLLGAILAEMESVKGLDEKFRAGKGPDDRSLDKLSPEQELDSMGMSLHEKMKRLAKKRQNHLSLRLKAEWALYSRKHFTDMIKKIGDKTKELQELFPAAKNREKALVKEEARDLSESLQVLKDAIKEQDQSLASALDIILKPLNEQYMVDISGGTVGVGQSVRGSISQTFGRTSDS